MFQMGRLPKWNISHFPARQRLAANPDLTARQLAEAADVSIRTADNARAAEHCSPAASTVGDLCAGVCTPCLISTTVLASQAVASRLVLKVFEWRCRSPLRPGAK
jgi:hypothetical protein